MKCIAAVVMVALAVNEASYVPYANPGYAVAPVVTYADAHHGPTVVQSNDPHSWAYASAVHNAYQAPIVSAYNNHWDVPAAVTYDAGHYYDNYHHGHSAAVIAAPVQHSATCPQGPTPWTRRQPKVAEPGTCSGNFVKRF
ncbi:cuticle protein [Culex quinquefasciatus]|uniref:Cuticle protein n=1 Tax=Culex quinquefasciatus TaxID=7176 RepID=B0W8Q5_CULQU|nr:cuticle protein [Culex quinquefasciatus]|eukprot:XP_001845120.1 cuticle protein [Culex quinquefasciatus]